MKLNTPVEGPIDEKTLARLKRETEEFMRAHPDYLLCEWNRDAVLTYMETHDLDWTRENLAKVYATLWKQMRLVPSGAQLNSMSANEVKERAEKIGIPKHDDFGRVRGYDWPCPIEQNSGYAESNYRVPRAELRPINYDTSMALKGYKPSKREFHIWSSDKMTSWMWANELSSLPDYLR
jgi:hypothetical protein